MLFPNMDPVMPLVISVLCVFCPAPMVTERGTWWTGKKEVYSMAFCGSWPSLFPILTMAFKPKTCANCVVVFI